MHAELPAAAPIPFRQRVIQAAPARREAAPLGAQGALPRLLTRLFGREADVAALQAMLVEEGVRLLTLTGPGGVGKTRLAISGAAAAADAFADGVAFVSLAPISDPALVLSAIARALDVREAPGRPLRDTLVEALGECDLLLVLDNCEHLVEAADDLAQLLNACPGLTVLATSRAPLAISGERRFPTLPLSLPSSFARPLGESPGESSAVALFVDRARWVNHDFTLTAQNIDAVTEICRRLEGLPLAIELAAAWVRVLSPKALLDHLDPRLPLLSGGGADQPARLRTMRDAIAWSYDLLSDDEARLFRRLAVFVGGFTFVGAEAVAAFPPSGARADLLILLAALIDKSLLHVRTDESPTRFLMLETVREFALERLAESGEEAVIRDLHATAILTLAEESEIPVANLGRPEDEDPVEAELANIRAALTWWLGTGRAESALRLAAALFTFWFDNSHIAEGQAWLDRGLALADEAVAASVRAKALVATGVLTAMRAELERASAALTSGLDLARDEHEPRILAWAHAGSSFLALIQGRLDAAEQHGAEAVRIGTAIGDHGSVLRAMLGLGRAAAARGDMDRAEAIAGEALDLARRIGSQWADYFLIALGLIAQARGDHPRTTLLHAQALRGMQAMRHAYVALIPLEGIAITAAGRDSAAAARLMGAAAALHRAHGTAPLPTDRPGYDAAVATATSRLGDASFAAAWEMGARLPLHAAIAEALALATSSGTGAQAVSEAKLKPAADGPNVELGGLSPRQREVLALVIAGCSDRQIADALFISQRTVSHHVGAIMDKLDARSRGEAAVRAVRAGLI